MRQREWVAADQMLVSLASIGQMAIIARLAGATELGQFAVVFGFYAVLAGGIRASTGEVILHERERPSSAVETDPVAAAAMLSLTLTPIIAAVSLVTTEWWSLIAAVAIASPLLAVKDTLRFVRYARDNARSAALWSSLHVAVELAASALALAALDATLSQALLIAWLLSGALALVQLLTLDYTFSFARGMMWIRVQARRMKDFGTEAVIGAASSYATLPLIAHVVSVEAAGALRLGQALLGPVAIALSTIRYSHISLLANTQDRRDLFSRSMLLAGILFAIATSAGLILRFTPVPLIALVIGGAAQSVREVVLPLSIQKGLSAATIPYTVLLKLSRFSRRTVFLRAASVTLAMVGSAIGGAKAGLVGAVWGMLTAAAATLILYLLATPFGHERDSSQPTRNES